MDEKKAKAKEEGSTQRLTLARKGTQMVGYTCDTKRTHQRREGRKGPRRLASPRNRRARWMKKKQKTKKRPQTRALQWQQ